MVTIYGYRSIRGTTIYSVIMSRDIILNVIVSIFRVFEITENTWYPLFIYTLN